MSGNNQSFLGENYLAMSLVSVSEKPFVVKVLQEKRKFLFFRFTYNKVSGTQKLNCRCQELDLRHFIFSLVPPGGFLPHIMSSYPVWKILFQSLKCRKHYNNCKYQHLVPVVRLKLATPRL